MTNTAMTMPVTTIHEASEAYLDYLREQGKKERTLYTYARDLALIEAFFGGEKPLTAIRSAQVGKFFKSDPLLNLPANTDGTQRPRAKTTVDKTVRVFRMFLVWAHQTGQIASLPLPKDTPMGHSQREDQTDASGS